MLMSLVPCYRTSILAGIGCRGVFPVVANLLAWPLKYALMVATSLFDFLLYHSTGKLLYHATFCIALGCKTKYEIQKKKNIVERRKRNNMTPIRSPGSVTASNP
ncbi:hypothetical protein C5167_018629 [Papaver somniferum]|uniref:Uncharacterized protein n=1 Tax=Papaver somniferum TaxID=3469 RepID=A0A4Y7IQX7_PAPSO|nr:hypothetical protein C5167_018629 [Papaver somniferum]